MKLIINTLAVLFLFVAQANADHAEHHRAFRTPVRNAVVNVAEAGRDTVQYFKENKPARKVIRNTTVKGFYVTKRVARGVVCRTKVILCRSRNLLRR